MIIRILIAAVAVAMLAGCMAPTMNEARQEGPYKVLTSKKSDAALAKCVHYEWQNQPIFGGTPGATLQPGRDNGYTVFTEGSQYFVDIQPQGAEFEGTPTARDIYLDNTPLQDPQGNMNFPNVKWEWRTGAVDQSYIQGTPSIENETTISIELRSGTPWVRAISNTQLCAVRVRFAWPALQSVDSGGNVNGKGNASFC